MKCLQITGVGLLVWTITLVWLEFKLVLMSPLVIGVIAILAVALPAYNLGRYVGQHFREPMKQAHPTHLIKRASIAIAQHHSQPTHPMPIVGLQTQHSNPTQPMPVIATR